MELDYGSHMDDPSSFWLNRLLEVVLSNFYTPPNNASIACVKYEMREPRFEVGGRSPILYTQCDSTYGFQSKKYGSIAYNHLKELDDLHYPKKYLIESESHPILLVGTLTGIQRKNIVYYLSKYRAVCVLTFIKFLGSTLIWMIG